MIIIITAISNKGKRKPIERNGTVRHFPNREAARQFLRNHPFLFKDPKIEKDLTQ
jgi:hypothetical protein